MRRIFILLLPIMLALALMSGCSLTKGDSANAIPAVQANSIQIDGSLGDWSNIPSKISLDTVDAGVGEAVNIPLDNKWKLNMFKMAWDGENLYFAYDVMDKLLLWESKNWWEGDNFEFFLSGNLDYKRDIQSLFEDELEDGANTCLQYYMAGPDNHGLFSSRTAKSAMEKKDQVQTKLIEKEDGYASEVVIPLSLLPELRALILEGKPIKCSVVFRTRDGDGMDLSFSNVSLPISTNKIKPVAMVPLNFELPKGLKQKEKSAGDAVDAQLPPERVTNFRAVAWNGEVSLSWDNPEKNFKGTKIVRKTEGYPKSPDDGDTIYDGSGTAFMDKKIKNDGTEYYYSAFSYSSSKAFSQSAERKAVPSEAAKPSEIKYTVMNELMGTNAFVDDPVDKISVLGFVREYRAWSWDETDMDAPYPNNQNAWNPSRSGNGWNFDAFYENLKKAGVTVSPVTQQTIRWLNGSKKDWHPANKPISPGDDSTDAQSYVEHADHMFQYAARYGGKAVDDKLLKLAPDQPRISGLGLIRYFENWNEPDGYWSGADSQFSPEDLAAMCSADYDGHMGSMGKTVGIKNADPDAKLVMGGLYSLKISYIKKMMEWSQKNRDGSFPADVLNFHYYCTDGAKGVAPEEDSFKNKLEKLNAFRELYLPDKELWISEFGYDTNVKSTQSAPSELAQTQWLLRSYLAVASSGFDRGLQYMLRDVNASDATMFASSGLVSSKDTNWVPKISWYFVSTMRQRLMNMFYDADVDSKNQKVSISRFRDADSYKGAYVLWCPTSDGTKVDGYTLTLVKGAKKATLVVPEDKNKTGAETPLEIKNGKVKVDVSETPVFVLFE